jgi:hypothetical protein
MREDRRSGADNPPHNGQLHCARHVKPDNCGGLDVGDAASGLVVVKVALHKARAARCEARQHEPVYAPSRTALCADSGKIAGQAVVVQEAARKGDAVLERNLDKLIVVFIRATSRPALGVNCIRFVAAALRSLDALSASPDAPPERD